jgi:acyl carrier protein
MNRDEVRKAFFDLLIPYVRAEDLSGITESSLLVEDLGVNSTRFVDVIVDAEDTFRIRVQDKDVARFQRVGDAIDFIVEKSAGAVGIPQAQLEVCSDDKFVV